MRFCAHGGYLVGTDSWLPTEPTDYYGTQGGGDIGCNNLVCYRCNQIVRNEVSTRIDETSSLPYTTRTYACDCEKYEASSIASMHLDTDDEVEPDWTPPWKCNGHPTIVPADPDWSTLQLDQPTNLHPAIDRLPGFVVHRIYQSLEREEDKQSLALAVASHAADPSLRARQAVANFFWQDRYAVGFDRVLEAWRADPSLYDEGEAAWRLHPGLKETLLHAIVYRVRSGAPGADTALAALRWAALRGTGLGSVLFWLDTVDQEWSKEHVEQLLDVSPVHWEYVVRGVVVEFPLRLVPGLRRVIAECHATLPQVEGALEEKYSDRAAPVIAALRSDVRS